VNEAPASGKADTKLGAAEPESGPAPGDAGAELGAALRDAILNGDGDAVQSFLDEPVQDDLSFQEWEALLTLAVTNEQTDIARMIVAREGSVGRQALLKACALGKNDTVQMLLNSGVPVDTRDDSGNTVLMLAAGMGRLEIVRALLAAGANPAATSEQGVTALSWAYDPLPSRDVSLKQRREIVRMLKMALRRGQRGLFADTR
jgi:ankyrin repeat protein